MYHFLSMIILKVFGGKEGNRHFLSHFEREGDGPFPLSHFGKLGAGLKWYIGDSP